MMSSYRENRQEQRTNFSLESQQTLHRMNGQKETNLHPVFITPIGDNPTKEGK